jgi:DNA-binding MarR family transcriptional regulator
MVKGLDEDDFKTIDHVGIALWRAALSWRARAANEMANRGYPWHLGARGEILAHMGPSGRSQSELTVALGMSKQAVQQLIDQLEADGVLKRVPDPDDRRAKRIELTELGLVDFAERNRVKRMIDAEYKSLLGEKAFAALTDALARLSQ